MFRLRFSCRCETSGNRDGANSCDRALSTLQSTSTRLLYGPRLSNGTCSDGSPWTICADKHRLQRDRGKLDPSESIGDGESIVKMSYSRCSQQHTGGQVGPSPKTASAKTAQSLCSAVLDVRSPARSDSIRHVPRVLTHILNGSRWACHPRSRCRRGETVEHAAEHLG